MQFITTGNRIAVENFVLGDLYTIKFTNGTYINSACIGIGENFVSFQRNEPELLFSLTMATAELVSSIELYAGGSGTNNYNDLSNKPQINDVELVGNKSLYDLGIQATISDIDTIRSGAAAGATAVQPAALADYQPIISDLDTIRSGAAAGATAVQPAALAAYQTIIDSSHKLDSDLVDDTTATHKFATAAQLAQIETNKNNILLNRHYGVKNIFIPTAGSLTNPSGFTGTITRNADNSYTINGTTGGDVYYLLLGRITMPVGTFVLYARPSDKSGIFVYNDGDWVDSGNSRYKTFNQATAQNIFLRIASNQTLDNYTIYPMICDLTAWNMSQDYETGALSNAELTAAIQALQAQLANQ